MAAYWSWRLAQWSSCCWKLARELIGCKTSKVNVESEMCSINSVDKATEVWLCEFLCSQVEKRVSIIFVDTSGIIWAHCNKMGQQTATGYKVNFCCCITIFNGVNFFKKFNGLFFKASMSFAERRFCGILGEPFPERASHPCVRNRRTGASSNVWSASGGVFHWWADHV